MEINRKESCSSCLWFRDYGYNGECRRRSPIRVQQQDNYPASVWPLVERKDWCGDYYIIFADKSNEQTI